MTAGACAPARREARDAGLAPPVILAATRQQTLAVIPLADLKPYALDLT